MASLIDQESQKSWLADQFEKWTDELRVESPSALAERVRYLPKSVTPLPGFFSFSVCPYWREPLDCVGVESPVREITIKKGAQVCFTVAILENAQLYWIVHEKTAPCMMVTADDELANIRLTSYIIPMIQASGLDHLIVSADETNPRKTGKTNRKLEWLGGGSLLMQGARSAPKLRSVSIQNCQLDEADGAPRSVGKDGNLIALLRGRMAGFEDRRKFIKGSTPSIRGQSLIDEEFEKGDQRYYHVPCLGCGFLQILRWSRINPDTGERSGIVWDTDPETKRLIPGSVRYRCQECGHQHSNDDKIRMLDPANGAEWRATAIPVDPSFRSYHISALYSPVGMQTWEACVRMWLEAWDEEAGKPRDNDKLQTFYNNILGESFELKGEKLRFEQVSPHRRHAYTFCHDESGKRVGLVPNKYALEHCGSQILILFCTVDVQGSWLAVGVFGWARGFRSFLLDCHRFDGDTEDTECPDTWGKVRSILETRIYEADDGARYRIQLTLVDAGFRQDTTFRFVREYSAGVVATKGRPLVRGGNLKHFSPMPASCVAFTILVDAYKERLSAFLKQSWEGFGLQPEGQFNAPLNATDAQLKELTVEVKREKVVNGVRVGWEWHRPSGSRNELWDLSVMNAAGLDMIAHEVCPPDPKSGAFTVSWFTFWELAAGGAFMLHG